MRRYDDPVEVRRRDESPEQFLWRGRLWQVRAVLAHWVETGPWWRQAAQTAPGGQAGHEGHAGHTGHTEHPKYVGEQATHDLLAERELWRVEARRGSGPGPEWGGVFDLAFSWDDGRWQLVGCED